MPKQKITKEISEIVDELTDRLDINKNLIFILKTANAEKDRLINRLLSDNVGLQAELKTDS